MASKTAAHKQELSTNNFVAICVLIAFIALVGSAVAAKFLVEKMILNNKVITKKVEASAQLDKNLIAYANLKEEYDSLGTIKMITMNSLPTKEDLTASMSLMESIAAKSGGIVKSVSSSSAGDIAPLTTEALSSTTPVPYSFSTTVESSYVGILNLLQNIEKSARPLHVVGIGLSGSTSSATAEIQLTTFYQSEADTSAKTEVVK